jgi:hypothetical protein
MRYSILFLFLFLLLLLNLKKESKAYPCAFRTEHQPYVDSRLRKYVDTYLDDMNKRGVDVSPYNCLDSILLVSVNTPICDDSHAIGCCDGKIVKVKFFTDVVYHDSSQYLQLLVYHELGHCMLHLPHENTEPSIMNSVENRPSSFYFEHWDYYIKEYIWLYNYYKDYPDGQFIP